MLLVWMDSNLHAVIVGLFMMLNSGLFKKTIFPLKSKFECEETFDQPSLNERRIP